MQDIGFVYYWLRHDYRTAAELVRQGEPTCPGAPWWLRSLAATTLAQGGDRQSSRAMWTAILQTAEMDWLRKDAERRLLQLQALDQIDALQRASTATRSATGAEPTGGRWSRARRAARRSRSIPTGAPFDLADGTRAAVAVVVAVAAAGRARGRGGRPLMIDTLPPLFALVVAGAFGAIVGSFLNVCIHRLPLGASIVWPSSACPHCKRELSWYENIPVVSYLRARAARCRTCRAPISIRYPFVEAMTAAHVRRRLVVLRPGPAAGVASRASAAR